MPSRRVTWFHPLALPFAAVTVMSLGAPLWVDFTHQPAGLLYYPGYPPSSSSLLAIPVSVTAIRALICRTRGHDLRGGDLGLPVRPGAARSLSAIDQTAAGDVSSAPWLTEQTMIHVPAAAPFAHGSTYAGALEAQVPGPLARKAGITSRTASAVFRDLIDFADPDQGFSEAYPAEAYLNFGMAGCLGAGLFLGPLVGWAWRKHRMSASRPRDLLYPVLLAGLVYGFRSDALTQVKDVLYPLLIAGLVIARHRLPMRASPTRAAAGEASTGATRETAG